MAFEVLWLQANTGEGELVAATSARQNRQLIDVLLAEGVVDVDGGDFTATEHADEWKVTVAAGRAIVAGDDQAGQGKYLVTMTTAEDVALNPPPGADKRIDVIYLQVLDPNAGGDAGYTAELGFVEGAVSGAPVVPAVSDSALELCSVLREAADATWADASIIDLREQVTLALDPPDSGSSAQPLVIQAKTFDARTGTPVMGTPDTNLSTSAMLFDAASTEAAASDVYVPAGWATVNVDLWWTNAGAGSGDVRWSIDTKSRVDGTNVYTSGTTSAATATAPAQNVMEVTRIATGLAVTADSLLLLNIARLGSNGADTLANDAGLYAIVITKAS